MMRKLLSLAAGLLFGLGLLVSGMADPARVTAFLDLFGAWDPTLAFVMGGAMIPSFIGWRIAAGRSRALLGGPLPGRPAGRIDVPLLLGSGLFGVGWGLAGICPGPAVVGLTTGDPGFLWFFLGLGAGMALWTFVLARPAARLSAQPAG